MKKFVWSNLILAMAVACLSGCGKKPENAISEKAAASYPLPKPPVVVQCHPGKPGGRLVIATIGGPKTFNPITQNESSSYDIVRLLFWDLLNYDRPTQTVKPGLAESWSVAPDGRTWTFKLRKNLRWSDGAPLTADDVVFTWNDVIYNPKINNVTRDQFIEDGKEFKVTKVNDLTVKVVTPEVYAPFLVNFGAGVPILPKHILAKSVADGTFLSAYGINWKPRDIVGSGPFVLQDYKPAQYVLLARNPYFCEVDTKGQRLPYLDNVIYEVVPNLDAISLRFLNGSSDVNAGVLPSDYDEYSRLAAAGKFKLLHLDIGLANSFFWFNENTNVNPNTGKPYVDPVKLKWFRNKKFRQACAYAINRQAIIQSVYGGRAVPDYGFVTPGNKKWYDSNIKKYPYDPSKARELLAEIGMKHRNADGILEDAEGHPIEFVLNTNSGNNVRNQIAIFIQADLDKLGFKVIYQPLEFNTLVEKISQTYNYDCVLLGLAGGTPDPSSSLNVLESYGFTHFWFPRQKHPSTTWEARIDYLMNNELKTLNFARRKKDFDEVQEILAEEVPMIFTVTPKGYAAVRSDLANLRPTALSEHPVTWNAEELYFMP